MGCDLDSGINVAHGDQDRCDVLFGERLPAQKASFTNLAGFVAVRPIELAKPSSTAQPWDGKRIREDGVRGATLRPGITIVDQQVGRFAVTTDKAATPDLLLVPASAGNAHEVHQTAAPGQRQRLHDPRAPQAGRSGLEDHPHRS
jgi:hypothetical protein